MRIWLLGSICLLITSVAQSYEGPSPLVDIKVEVSVSQSSSGLYSYAYKLVNPGTNDGDIYSFDISTTAMASEDLSIPAGIKHCSHYDKNSSQKIASQHLNVAVGSDGPKGWSCGYGTLKGFTEIAYGWGANDSPYLIKPGKSQGGFILTSKGLPSIREVLVKPEIDLDRLPPEYEERIAKMDALEAKIKWTGKTIGPKAPPKIINAASFLSDLVGSKDQSAQLGWIKNKGLLNSLEVKLREAQTKIASGDLKTAKKILNAFLNEVAAQKDKGLSPEAYAVLYFNAKYLADRI